MKWFSSGSSQTSTDVTGRYTTSVLRTYLRTYDLTQTCDVSSWSLRQENSRRVHKVHLSGGDGPGRSQKKIPGWLSSVERSLEEV